MKRKALLIPAALVVVFWLVSKNGDDQRAVSGTIEADEVRAASRAGGRVVALHAREGDALTNGQLIAELQADEIKAHRDQAAALLAEMEAGPRPQQIAASKSEWDSLRAELEFAVDDAKRKEELSRTQSISDTDRDEAVSRAAAVKEKVAAAKERYDELSAGTRKEQMDQARAQLAAMDATMDEMRITAPADSFLETLHVKVGDVVAPNGSVATLLYLNERWVRVYVPEPWLPKIKAGDEVALFVDGYPSQAFKGVVASVSRRAEFTPRNVQTREERIKQVFGVKIRIEDDGGILRAGMTARAKFNGLP